MRKLLIAVLSVAVFSFSQTAQAAMFGMDKAEVEETIRSYLLEHPELIKEVIEKYAERERLRLQKEQKDAWDANRIALEYDPNAPVIGNPDGNVTIVIVAIVAKCSIAVASDFWLRSPSVWRL